MSNKLDLEIRLRMSAGERKEQILEAAVAEFAVKGLYGTSTETIAKRAGVSQPYLFRLFGTKKGLFLEAVELGFDRIQDMFGKVMASAPGDGHARMHAMGDRYFGLLAQPEDLMMQLQSYAACSDPEVAAVVRRRYGELYEYIEAVLDVPKDKVREFVAHGMLLNVAAAMNLLGLAKNGGWAERCIDHDDIRAAAVHWSR